jgi:hypothetical protein
MFRGQLLFFPHFGVLNQEKSGNPACDTQPGQKSF